MEKYLISLAIEYQLHVCVLVSMQMFNPFHIIPSGQSPIKENVLKRFLSTLLQTPLSCLHRFISGLASSATRTWRILKWWVLHCSSSLLGSFISSLRPAVHHLHRHCSSSAIRYSIAAITISCQPSRRLISSLTVLILSEEIQEDSVMVDWFQIL